MSLNKGKFNGKVALVTGASRGIGAEIAKKLAAGGAAFVGVHYGRNKEAALSIVEEIKGLGSKAVALQGDLSTGISGVQKLWHAFEEAVRSELGTVHIDILVNNAGTGSPVLFEETSNEDFDEVINVNLKAPYFIAQAASPYLRNGGRIINISSGFTRVAAPMQAIYAASKGAIDTLSLALAPHFAPRGITVNAVAPGVTATDMNKEMRSTPEGLAAAAAMSAFNRVGTTEDVADVVAFVASEEARWTTGQLIDASGGARL